MWKGQAGEMSDFLMVCSASQWPSQSWSRTPDSSPPSHVSWEPTGPLRGSCKFRKLSHPMPSQPDLAPCLFLVGSEQTTQKNLPRSLELQHFLSHQTPCDFPFHQGRKDRREEQRKKETEKDMILFPPTMAQFCYDNKKLYFMQKRVLQKCQGGKKWARVLPFQQALRHPVN